MVLPASSVDAWHCLFAGRTIDEVAAFAIAGCQAVALLD